MVDTMTLSGSFTLQSLDRIRSEVAAHLNKPDAAINLSGVADVDSSAVSMLLHWRRAAQGANRTLHLIAPPPGLVSLARLYGVEEFLAFE